MKEKYYYLKFNGTKEKGVLRALPWIMSISNSHYSDKELKMIDSIKNSFTLKDVYLNNAIRVDISNEHDKTKHLFKDVWMFQKYLVENSDNKEIAYRIFAEFMKQYHTYMASAVEQNTALNSFRQSGYKWPLAICPFKTTDSFEHIVLH